LLILPLNVRLLEVGGQGDARRLLGPGGGEQQRVALTLPAGGTLVADTGVIRGC
jgi:hypothetical protein